MHIAYFPKNDQEAPLFAQEFAAQRATCRIFKPTDVWLACNGRVTTGAGPPLTLDDLDRPSQDSPFTEFDLVFQRSIPSWTQTYGAEIVEFFFDLLYLTQDTTPVVNKPLATILARRKHLAAAILSRTGLSVPPYFASPNPIRNMKITKITPPPTIVKTLQGAGGLGVLLAPNTQVLGDLLSLFYKNQQIPILQHYIPTPYDLRVFLVGDTIIGAIRRQGNIYKHNVSLGATAAYLPPTSLPAEITELSHTATQTLKLDIAGVDLLLPPQGPVVLEVNPSPGFHGLARASKTNVQQQIVSYLLRKAKN